MKRISTITLILVMCFTIVFPASAAVSVIDEYGFISYIQDRIYEIEAKTGGFSSLPAGYDYYMLVSWSASDITLTKLEDRQSFTLYIFKTPNINSASTIYYTSISRNSSGKILGGTSVSSTIPSLSAKFNAAQGLVFTYSNGGDARKLNIITNLSNSSLSNIASLRNTASSLGYDFEIELVPDTPPVDLSSLQALLTQAKERQSIGYTQSSWDALQEQITAAETLLASTGYTQTDIDASKDDLQTAIDGLTLIPPVDSSELEELLVEADAIEDIGYTAQTWTRFDSARYAGHSLMASQGYTQTDIDSASTELRVSMGGLTLAQTPAPDPPPAVLGYDLQSGDVSGYLNPVSKIFYAYVFSAQPIAVGIFGIILGILIIPRLLGVIIPNIRR